MFRIILIVFFIVVGLQKGVASTIEKGKKIDTLEEINADLVAKKASAEPFDQKKVKIDLESLGLDPVKETDLPPIANSQKPTDQTPPQKPETQKTEEVKDKKDDIKIDVPQVGVISKIKNLLTKTNPLDNKKTQDQKVLPNVEAVKEKDVAKPELLLNKKSKKTTESYINSLKKANLKKRLIAEKRAIENEKRQKEKLKKLTQLRKKYLTKIKALTDSDSQEDSEDDLDDDDKDVRIIPKRRDLGKFTSYERPPEPILNRYRSIENKHIAMVLTKKERIEILFKSIDSGDSAYFDSAYKDIEQPNVRNESGDTILSYAILTAKHNVVASILKKGADPNMQNALGYRPIAIAIEMLDLRSLTMLIDNNADVNYVDKFGRTYLMQASRLGFLPAVDLLIEKGVDVNATDIDSFSALSIAYRYKKEIIVKYLLKHDAKTWVEKPYDSTTQTLMKELETRWKN